MVPAPPAAAVVASEQEEELPFALLLSEGLETLLPAHRRQRPTFSATARICKGQCSARAHPRNNSCSRSTFWQQRTSLRPRRQVREPCTSQEAQRRLELQHVKALVIEAQQRSSPRLDSEELTRLRAVEECARQPSEDSEEECTQQPSQEEEEAAASDGDEQGTGQEQEEVEDPPCEEHELQQEGLLEQQEVCPTQELEAASDLEQLCSVKRPGRRVTFGATEEYAPDMDARTRASRRGSQRSACDSCDELFPRQRRAAGRSGDAARRCCVRRVEQVTLIIGELPCKVPRVVCTICRPPQPGRSASGSSSEEEGDRASSPEGAEQVDGEEEEVEALQSSGEQTTAASS